MYKKHLIRSLFLVLIYITMACETVSHKPTYSIQIQIEEANLTQDEKTRAIANIQNRLESAGAKDITITEQEEQKVTFNFHGKIKPQKLRRSFAVSGKLEFFEVCNEHEILYRYLSEIHGNQKGGDLLSEVTEDIKTVDDILGIRVLGGYAGPVFATVSRENKNIVIEKLLKKEPVSIHGLEQRVKFLLGKSNRENQHEIYAVYVSSENKAPIDGSYVIDAYAEESNYGDSYVVSIQKNKEGAKIWEKMTEKAHMNQGNIAVVVDNLVYSAPSVSVGKITGGMSQISSNLSKEQATTLAAVIRSGSIPKMKILQESILKSYKQ
ncbi:hypothetical protein [uncultured Kordia sp.]|uniref:SecDF P1 head subdomain-containing protein n=1 Tax=uncultured Kordia sp. TaxID=507699 RepID=UPI0026337577|nr:hypothetical protein [uncultured Kordia sp.]